MTDSYAPVRAILLFASATLLAAATAGEPTAPPSVAAPAAGKPLAATLGVYVFPNAGQKPEQQSKDEGECYAWATQQTGVDPFAAQKQAEQAQQSAQQTQEQAAAGAKKGGGVLRGAAAGAIIADATGGDGDKGAGAGAALGAMKRAGQANAAKKQSEKAAAEAEAATQASAAQTGEFKKAFSVCLESKKYMVKY
jgi:type IV secretory pathway VirB10-like protein